MSDVSPARALGIDFGTSNSTVGWHREGASSLIALEDGKITLPSVVFFNIEERRPVYGRLALQEYLEGYEGRLMRSLKSLLGSKLIKHDTSVLGSALPFKDLLGMFIGGGTSDFTLIRLSPERHRVAERQSDILATGGVHIGGTDFDKQLSLQGVMPLFGYGSRMKSGALMPTSYHLNLATWHTINALYSQKSQLALGSMRYDIEDSFGIDRLFKLIEQRAGHWLAMEVEASKIELTEHDSRHIDLRRVEPELTAELTRALFEEAIEGLLERVRGSVTELLAKAGVSEDQVDTVFFTGGSSGIPALRNSVSAMLPNARHVEGNIFGSIGSGLAIEARKRYGAA